MRKILKTRLCSLRGADFTAVEIIGVRAAARRAGREIWFPQKRRVESYLRVTHIHTHHVCSASDGVGRESPPAWQEYLALSLVCVCVCTRKGLRAPGMELGSSLALITHACSYSSFTPQFERRAARTRIPPQSRFVRLPSALNLYLSLSGLTHTSQTQWETKGILASQINTLGAALLIVCASHSNP